MRYRITHSTVYQYSTPVSVCHNVIILAPQPTDCVDVTSHRLTIRPLPEIVDQRYDVFGNTIHRFSLEQHHSQLTITSLSDVKVTPPELPSVKQSPTLRQLLDGLQQRTDANWLQVAPYRYDSPRIRQSETFAGYAATSFKGDSSLLTGLTDLTHRIYEDFSYDKDATDVDTPAEQAFESRRGVCQDFAHIAVSCLRSLKVPARYVSGYLRTRPPSGRERLVGADQSHAWVSVYCGEQAGWVEFDPTNDCHCGTDHIPIAYGRDYGDVVPIKGVFLGGGEPALSVSVDVAPMEGQGMDSQNSHGRHNPVS